MLIFFRDRPLVIAAFVMPLIVFIVLAEGLGDTLAILPGNLDYRQFFLPGMVSYTVISQSVNTGVSIVTDRQMGFQTITAILMYPALFLSGVFFPLNNVPIWLDVIAKFNPLTYAVAPIREVALSEHLKDVPADAPFQITHVEWFGYTLSTWEELGIVVVLGTAMLIIAVRAIRTTE